MHTLIQEQNAAGLAKLLAPCVRLLTGGVAVFREDTALTIDTFEALPPPQGAMRVFCPEAGLEETYTYLTDHLTEGVCVVGVEGLGLFSAAADKVSADNLIMGVSAAAPLPQGGRLAGKIVVVTGAAQGFGQGLAWHIAGEGAYVIVADLNEPAANAFALQLCERYGAGAARAVTVDVSSAASVERMVEQTVLYYGGLDLLVSNAGVLKAGGLDEMTQESFEFVTRVNYTGYFLCAKFAAEIMRLQHRFAPARTMDIIQINSKSGLEGSNKNFAYAGGKFGGIGLTQSFAKELVDYNIKVNSICPGNFLDGPLWCDPERGLFVQYLKAGKVPGAQTVEDVKRAYESKVPMGRGCVPLDVARALYYCVEQTYETGQAIPVTGGQNMLN